MIQKSTIFFAGFVAAAVLISLFFNEAPMAKYAQGDKMETRTLPADDGSTVTLPQDQWTVLYFYPKDDTPGCTTQAKTFSALSQDYKDNKILVYGISTDNLESHKEFKEKHSLKITLLSDPEGVLAQDFGVEVTLGMCSRDAVILNPEGAVDVIHRGVSPKGSPYEILDYIMKKQAETLSKF